MASVSESIINLQNNTQINKQNQPKEYSKTVDGDTFLQLLTEQLKYQDPLNPMDNTDMLAQEAQFASLEQMEALASSFSQFTNAFQANSLMGQTVEVEADGQSAKGVVDYIDYSDASGASLSIGGKLYPISSVTKVYPKGAEVSDSNKEENSSTIGQTLLESINDNIGKIASKVSDYLKTNDTEKSQ